MDERRGRPGQGYLTDLRAELRRCWRPPYEVPVVVVVNASLVLALWWLSPVKLFDLFFSLHGELALPMVLTSWMYADVPATNLLGSDAAQMRAALDDPRRLRRLMDVKNVALWMFVTPIALLSTVLVSVASRNGVDLPGVPPPADTQILPLLVVAVVWMLVAPLGALGVSAWVGILWPYHPIPLKERWEDRRPLRQKVWRWGVLVVLPYGVVPALTLVVVVPSAVYWHFNATNGLSGPLQPDEFFKGTLITCVISVAMLLVGRKVAVRLAARRRDALDAYLADPTLG